MRSRLLPALLLALSSIALAAPAQAQSRAAAKWHSSHPLWMLRPDIVCSSTATTCSGGAGGVGLGGTNVWTGSNTFTDSLFTIADDGDPAKKMQFQVSGVTTGNTVVALSFGGTAAAPTVSFPNGVVGTPGLSLANSATTGLWSRAANSLDFSSGGSFIMEMNFGSLNAVVVPSGVSLGWIASATTPGSGPDTMFRRGGAAATIQMGTDANGAPVTQTFRAHNGIIGSNISSPRLNLGSQIGTGTGNSGGTFIQRPNVVASGTGAQSASDANGVCGTKTLSNTSATLTTVATVGLASNSSGAVLVKVSVRCDDGTNFDSDFVTSYVAYVNKAGAITLGTPVTTATAAANNSGSCTVAPTFTAGASLINVNVTPVITTITPTTTTASFNIENFGAGAVICQ